MDNQQTQIPQNIRNFLESMLEDAKMTTINPEAKEEMIKELFARLDNFMLTTIIEALPSDKLEEFTKMSDEGKNREELENYLKANIPNAEEAFARAMLEFRDIYLGTVEAGRNIPSKEPSAEKQQNQNN